MSEIKIYQPEYGREEKVQFKPTIENYDPRAPYQRSIWQEDVARLKDALKETNPNCPFMVNLELSRFPRRNAENYSTPVAPITSQTPHPLQPSTTPAPEHHTEIPDNETPTHPGIKTNRPHFACQNPYLEDKACQKKLPKAQDKLFASATMEIPVNAKLSDQQYQDTFNSFAAEQSLSDEEVKISKNQQEDRMRTNCGITHRVGRPDCKQVWGSKWTPPNNCPR